jgi:peptide deformylase
MSVRHVLRYPHPSLKRAAKPVEAGEDALVERLARDLVDTMHSSAGCVGLAATQLDELVRMVVVDVRGHRRATTSNGQLVLVNPRIVHSSGAELAREGCLSLPDITANVTRATAIVVEATGLCREALVIESTGFEARCLQHEIDHLDGVLFLDRVASLTTDVFRRTHYS